MTPTVEPAGVSVRRIKVAADLFEIRWLGDPPVEVVLASAYDALSQQLAMTNTSYDLLCDRLETAEQQLAEMRGAAEAARKVLSTIYAKYGLAIGPYSSQAQKANVMLGAALAPTSQPSRGKCEGCGNEIDPDTCGCGEPINGYHDNHTPIPMGCDCHRSTRVEADCAQPERQATDDIVAELREAARALRHDSTVDTHACANAIDRAITALEAHK
jgi:hypothetical protein